MSDSDHTPPDRPRNKRLQTATDRDFDGLKHKAQREARRSPAMGTPVVRPQMATDQLEQLAIAVAEVPSHRRTGTTFEASVLVEDAVPEEIEFESLSGVTDTMFDDPDKRALFHKIEHEKRVRANAIMEAMGNTPPGPRMSSLERTVRRLKGVIVAIAIPFASSAVLVGKWLMSKAAEEERARIEREQILERDRDYEQRLRVLEAITPRYTFPSGPTRPETNPRKEP